MSHVQARTSLFGWNRLLCAHYILGVLAALLLPAGLADTQLGRFLLGVFPALGSLSSHSADPGVWGSYLVLMLLISGALIPVVTVQLYRESRPRGDARALKAGVFLAVLCVAMIYLMLFGSAGFWSERSFQGHTKGDLLGRFLLHERLGLALIGSLYLSMLVLFASILAVLPLAPFKSPSRPE